jgi:hypothetical protein
MQNQLVNRGPVINATDFIKILVFPHVTDDLMDAANAVWGACIRLAIFCARLNMLAMASPGMTAAITILSKRGNILNQTTTPDK